MSKISIASSLPRTILRGFKDDSGAPQVLEEESLPIHLPLIPLITQWGPSDDAVLVGGSGFNAIFGSASLDFTKPFATHQTAIANAVFPEGNLAFVRRLVPTDAKIARVRIGIDVVETEVPQYDRNPDGTFKRDAQGALIDLLAPETGYRAKWTAIPVPELAGETTFGQAASSSGALVGSGGATSTFYPILDAEVRFIGGRGDNIGFRLAAPTLLSSQPANADLVSEAGAFIYRFFAVERADAQSSASVKTTRQGEQFVEFSLKDGVIDRATEQLYFADDVLLDAYESTNPEEFDGYGPFGKLHFYHNHVQTVLDLIAVTEASFGLMEAAVTPEHTINILTAQSVTGVPYYTFQVDGPAANGLLFSENTNHFALGGADGTISNAVFDQLVREELVAFNDGPIPYSDSAMYPFSCFYDSGFTMDTKKEMANILQRPDVYVVAATQDAQSPLNSSTAESSIASALRAYFRSTPESEYYGTGTARVVVMGNAGEMIGSKYKGVLPFTVAFAKKCAAYMGAGIGYMSSADAFDSAPGNVVRDFKNHNAVFKPANARNQDWQNGLVFAQNFDRNSIFWPGLQTIYADNTSILNSFFNMAICCNLTRVGERAWRNFTGNSKLSNEQFVRRVDDYIIEQTNGRYDERGDIIPRTYYTAGDEARGYSWHTDITFASQGMKTVETLTIVAKRREEEAA